MHRPTGRIRDATGYEAIIRRRDIWSTDTGIIRSLKGFDQIGEPMWIWPGIIVNVGDNLACGLLEANIPRATEPPIFTADDSTRILSRDATGPVRRAIIDHHDLIVGIFELAQPLE